METLSWYLREARGVRCGEWEGWGWREQALLPGSCAQLAFTYSVAGSPRRLSTGRPYEPILICKSSLLLFLPAERMRARGRSGRLSLGLQWFWKGDGENCTALRSSRRWWMGKGAERGLSRPSPPGFLVLPRGGKVEEMQEWEEDGHHHRWHTKSGMLLILPGGQIK